MAANPLLGFQVDRAQIVNVGHDLQRPECILAEPDGTLWAADARGGVMRIAPDGSQRFIAKAPAAASARRRPIPAAATRPGTSKARCPTAWPSRATATS